MALLNVFKKKQPSGKKEKSPEKISNTQKTKKKAEAKVLKKEKTQGAKTAKTSARPVNFTAKGKPYHESFRILQSPHVTEKATALADKNQYIFKVYHSANKTEIKKAVESIYNVQVVSVHTASLPGKKRRLGKQTGWKKGYKKAIVSLKAGQEIEILPR